jgi:hypothetical protein
MTSPPDRRRRAAEIHANMIRTFKTQLILMMAIAASKAAGKPKPSQRQHASHAPIV